MKPDDMNDASPVVSRSSADRPRSTKIARTEALLSAKKRPLYVAKLTASGGHISIYDEMELELSVKKTKTVVRCPGTTRGVKA
jgi:hypothetical protein